MWLFQDEGSEVKLHTDETVGIGLDVTIVRVTCPRLLNLETGAIINISQIREEYYVESAHFCGGHEVRQVIASFTDVRQAVKLIRQLASKLKARNGNDPDLSEFVLQTRRVAGPPRHRTE